MSLCQIRMEIALRFGTRMPSDRAWHKMPKRARNWFGRCKSFQRALTICRRRYASLTGGSDQRAGDPAMTLSAGSLSPICWLYMSKAVFPVVTTSAVSSKDFTVSRHFESFWPAVPISHRLCQTKAQCSARMSAVPPPDAIKQHFIA